MVRWVRKPVAKYESGELGVRVEVRFFKRIEIYRQRDGFYSFRKFQIGLERECEFVVRGELWSWQGSRFNIAPRNEAVPLGW